MTKLCIHGNYPEGGMTAEQVAIMKRVFRRLNAPATEVLARNRRNPPTRAHLRPVEHG